MALLLPMVTGMMGLICGAIIGLKIAKDELVKANRWVPKGEVYKR